MPPASTGSGRMGLASPARGSAQARRAQPAQGPSQTSATPLSRQGQSPHRHRWPSLLRAVDEDSKAPGETKLGDWLAGTFRSNRANEKLAAQQADASAAFKPKLLPEEEQQLIYPWWWVLPLQPYSLRKTCVEEVVPGRIWSLEQPHGAINIVVNIRMTVVKLAGGGLWVHAPIAPTPECVRLVQEIVGSHGPVKYIVHPTYAVEHKIFVGRFSQAFPKAQVWVAPGQWSFPLQLPMSWLGVFPQRVYVIGKDSCEWSEELPYAVLSLPLKGVGPFVEAAFLHKETKTLLVTDTIVCPSEEPPAVCTFDPEPLLLTERDSISSQMTNESSSRRKGWMKTVLLALYLRPDAVQLDADGGFAWSDDWAQAFQDVCGKPMVPPILSKLVLNRYPVEVLDWAGTVASWDFTHVMAAHFSARAELSPAQLLEAFEVLKADGTAGSPGMVGEGQCTLLNQVDKFLVDNGLAEKSPAQ